MQIPSQHVVLLRVLEDQHELVDAIDLILDALNERSKRIRDVIDESIRDPVGGDIDVIFQLFDTPANILRMGSSSEMKLRGW